MGRIGFDHEGSCPPPERLDSRVRAGEAHHEHEFTVWVLLSEVPHEGQAGAPGKVLLDDHDVEGLSAAKALGFLGRGCGLDGESCIQEGMHGLGRHFVGTGGNEDPLRTFWSFAARQATDRKLAQKVLHRGLEFPDGFLEFLSVCSSVEGPYEHLFGLVGIPLTQKHEIHRTLTKGGQNDGRFRLVGRHDEGQVVPGSATAQKLFFPGRRFASNHEDAESNSMVFDRLDRLIRSPCRQDVDPDRPSSLLDPLSPLWT